MMIARHTGYLPGVFAHMVANEQIYDRHVDAANELAQRAQKLLKDEIIENIHYKTPKLILNSEKRNFYDFTIDDFTLEDYEPIKPQLKLELGI